MIMAHRTLHAELSSRLVVQLVPSGTKKILIVCGQTSFELSGAREALLPLLKIYEVEEWSGYSANPKFEDLLAGLQIANAFLPDVVVGVGGGSSLDMAKLIAVFVGENLAGVKKTIQSNDVLDQRGPGLILVPTTSGSGSEETHFSVLYLDGEKYSVRGAGLHSDTSIVDWRLTMSASSRQKASSAIDALAQATESLWARGSTVQSRKLSRKALKSLSTSIRPFVMGADEHAATRVAKGSNLAGKAINIAKTTAPHALSYRLTFDHDVPHGNAVGLFLGAFIDFHEPTTKSDAPRQEVNRRLTRQVRFIRKILKIPKNQTADSFVRSLLEQFQLIHRLEQLPTWADEELTRIIDSVNQERLSNNPIVPSSSDLREILGKLTR